MIRILNSGKPLLGKSYSLKHPQLYQWRNQRNTKAPHAWNEFNEKMSNGSYKIEQSPCISCGHKVFLLLSELDKRNIQISYVICRKCGLVQLNPRCDQNSYNDWYANLYMQLWEQLSEIKEVPQADHFINNQFHLIKNRLAPKDKILEIGCNMGATQRFLVKQGFDVYGCDYHEKAIEFAKQYVPEATIKKGGIDSFSEQEGTFKLIYMNHVLEHIVDPDEFIKKIYRMLAPGGYALIEVPGLKNWISTVKKNNIKTTIQFAHISYFTSKCLQHVFAKNGFETVYIDNTVTGLFKKSNSIQMVNFKTPPPKEFYTNLFFLMLIRFFEIFIPSKIRKYIKIV